MSSSCGIVKASSAHEHFESGCIVLCRSARCHFELVKLCGDTVHEPSVPDVMSSSSYSSSSEVRAGNLEVRRVPGNGFSLCAAPTFSRVQGILNRGRNGFPECVGMEICTGTIPNTRVRTRGTEVRSSCGLEVCRMHGIELS